MIASAVDSKNEVFPRISYIIDMYRHTILGNTSFLESAALLDIGINNRDFFHSEKLYQAIYISTYLICTINQIVVLPSWSWWRQITSK